MNAAFGDIQSEIVNGEFVVDTGHTLAFRERLDCDVETVGGWKPPLLSGEGLICRFRGSGTVYVQIRNAPLLCLLAASVPAGADRERGVESAWTLGGVV